ncbi:MAG: hypothetical protein O3B82_04795 [Bacteroidetes bacterium]|nr:hypothetical protein [Bacteroidota bacterium]
MASTKSSKKISPSVYSQKSPSSWLIVWAGLSILVPVLIIYAYSAYPKSIKIGAFELKKLQEIQDVDAMLIAIDSANNPLAKSVIQKTDSISTDSMPSNARVDMPFIGPHKSFIIPKYEFPQPTDTTKYRIILIGDSESGGLRYPLNDYCFENGHRLVLSMEWYSATIFNFARSDTIERIIARYKPTYIFLVFGLNELYARDLKIRKIASDFLAEKLKGIPYTWIGPANWQEDFGINTVFKSSADTGSYFMTKKLVLPRAEDGRHPSSKGYRMWMDSIAVWLETEAKYKISMKVPTKRGRPFRSSVITLNAAKFRGY